MALLFVSTLDDPRTWRDALAAFDPDLEYRVWPEMGAIEDVDSVLAWHPPAGLLASLPKLKLIQSLGAGIDHLLSDPALPESVPVARLVDPELTRQMVEYVLLAVMTRQRRIASFQAGRPDGLWQPEMPVRPDQCRVSVLGLGEIGGATARELVARGYDVAGWSRSAKTIDGVTCYHGQDQLHKMLGRTDILANLLPLTPGTENILNAALFAAMPRGAFMINVGRGKQLVDDDLLDALDNGHLSGAWLDVFRSEPLPADHRFWAHPAIVMTPHIAGWTVPESAAQLVVENRNRVLAGQPPKFQVTLGNGY